MSSLKAQQKVLPSEGTHPRTGSHLLLHMACVLFNELGEADIVCAKPAESVEDTGLTGMEKWEILGHL